MIEETAGKTGQHSDRNEEIDVFEHAEQGQEVPHSHAYRVRVDGENVRVETDHPTGELLLGKVGKRPCAYELISEYRHRENQVIEPHETVDLRAHGLKGFITAHKEIVTIFIKGDPYQFERGNRTVAEILSKVGETPEGYTLLEEKDGPPMPLPADKPVEIHGCEIFHTQVNSGGAS